MSRRIAVALRTVAPVNFVIRWCFWELVSKQFSPLCRTFANGCCVKSATRDGSPFTNLRVKLSDLLTRNPMKDVMGWHAVIAQNRRLFLLGVRSVSISDRFER